MQHRKSMIRFVQSGTHSTHIFLSLATTESYILYKCCLSRDMELMCSLSQKLSLNLEKALALSESCVFLQRASPRLAFNPGSQNLKIRKRILLSW